MKEQEFESTAEPLSGLDPEVLANYGAMLAELAEQGAQYRNGFLPRWEQNQRLYNNEQGADDVKHIPLIKPKAKFLLGSIIDGITSADPPFVAFDVAGNRASIKERQIRFVLEKAGWRKGLKKAAINAYNTGKGFLQVSFNAPTEDKSAIADGPGFARALREAAEADPEGTVPRRLVSTKHGVEIRSVSPKNLFVWPPTANEMDEVVFIGHVYSEVRLIAEQKAARGEYDAEAIKGLPAATSGDGTSTVKKGTIRVYGTTNQFVETSDPSAHAAPTGEEKEDRPYDILEFAQAIWFTDADGDGSPEPWLVTFHIERKRVVAMRKYPWSIIWYIPVDFDVDAEDVGFFRAGSLCNDAKGVQLALNSLWTSFQDAAELMAGPPIVSPSGMWSQRGKALRYRSREVISIDADNAPTTVQVSGDVSALPTGIELIDRFGDRALMVSKTATGEALPPSGTATEAVLLQQNQNVSLGDVHGDFAVGLVPMVMLIDEMITRNADVMRDIYGESYPVAEGEEQVPEYVEWGVHGMTPSRNPGVVVAVAQVLANMAADPEFGLDKYQIAKLILVNSSIENKEAVQMAEEQFRAAVAAAQKEADDLATASADEASAAPAEGEVPTEGVPAEQGGEVQPPMSPEEAMAMLDSEFPDMESGMAGMMQQPMQ